MSTTDSNHHLPIASNELDQQFAAQAPDEKWAADITAPFRFVTEHQY